MEKEKDSAIKELYEFLHKNGDYTCKVAENVKEAKELIEAIYQYV